MTAATTERTTAVALGPGDKVAIIAGRGRLPENVAETLAENEHRLVIFRVVGEADPALGAGRFECENIALEEFANLIARLKRVGATHVVLAGGIARRPSWRKIPFNFALIRVLGKAIVALSRGDDGLLRTLIRSVEEHGIKVVGAHQVVPELLAAEGPLGSVKPAPGDRRDIDAAREAARAIGLLDVGQAAVAIGGRAIALEDIEGTDALLVRVAGLRGHGRLAGRKRGVLVKCAKPGQELRADLPAIGPLTVKLAHEAGLAGIAVDADHALVLDAAEAIANADASGLFIVGLPQDGRP